MAINGDNSNYQIDVCENHKIVFKQNHPKITNNEEIDWTKVYRIQLLKIANDNELSN